MREIAKGTFTVEFPAIMGIVWKRMKDIKTPQHPLKCLILLEFLLREGNILPHPTPPYPRDHTLSTSAR